LVDPDGRDWYRSHDTGREIWYEGSDPRDGYDHIGPNAWIRGDRDYLYYEQNELVGIEPNPRYFMRADVNSSPITERDREYYSELALTIGSAIYGGLSKTSASQGYWLGNNGKYYSCTSGRGPNQWTGSRSGAFAAANNYRLAGRVTVIGSAGLGVYSTREGYLLDGNQFGYNAQRAAASSAGSILGGWAGFKVGAAAGGFIGAGFGGIGAIPGAVIGGVVGGVGLGIGGGIYGGHVGEQAIDRLHRKP